MQVLFLSQFIDKENWNFKELDNLPKNTGMVNVKTYDF